MKDLVDVLWTIESSLATGDRVDSGDQSGCFDDPSIRAQSGARVSLLNPTVDQIDIDDIATGLSNVCRFGGQVPQHYSVAEHSVTCAMAAWSRGFSARRCMAVLMHDASEAYLGDVIRPLKGLLGDTYRDLEYRMQSVIHEYADIEIDSWTAAVIKFFDNAICHAEMSAICPQVLDEVAESFDEVLQGNREDWCRPEYWPADRASQEFLSMYRRLQAEIIKEESYE